MYNPKSEKIFYYFIDIFRHIIYNIIHKITFQEIFFNRKVRVYITSLQKLIYNFDDEIKDVLKKNKKYQDAYSEIFKILSECSADKYQQQKIDNLIGEMLTAESDGSWTAGVRFGVSFIIETLSANHTNSEN